jgi:hypothetical protein
MEICLSILRAVYEADGRFQSIEGNTSSSSDSDGGAVEVRDRSTGSMRCVFVSMAL